MPLTYSSVNVLMLIRGLSETVSVCQRYSSLRKGPQVMTSGISPQTCCTKTVQTSKAEGNERALGCGLSDFCKNSSSFELRSLWHCDIPPASDCNGHLKRVCKSQCAVPASSNKRAKHLLSELMTKCLGINLRGRCAETSISDSRQHNMRPACYRALSFGSNATRHNKPLAPLTPHK